MKWLPAVERFARGTALSPSEAGVRSMKPGNIVIIDESIIFHIPFEVSRLFRSVPSVRTDFVPTSRKLVKNR